MSQNRNRRSSRLEKNNPGITKNKVYQKLSEQLQSRTEPRLQPEREREIACWAHGLEQLLESEARWMA